MKKTLFIRPAIILLAASLLSGCLWWPEEDGYRRGNHYDRDHHGEYRDHHDKHRDNRGEHQNHHDDDRR